MFQKQAQCRGTHRRVGKQAKLDRPMPNDFIPRVSESLQKRLVDINERIIRQR